MMMMSRRPGVTLFSASWIIPPVKAPSPMTATVKASEPLMRSPWAKPRAADREVELCPAPKQSYSLSLRLVKPERPPPLRRVENCS